MNNYYTPSKILVAFIDQILVIRYNMYLQEKDRFLFSCMKTNLDDLFNDREILIDFLVKCHKNKSKEEVYIISHLLKIYKQLGINELIQEVVDEDKKNSKDGYTLYGGIPYSPRVFNSFDFFSRFHTNYIEFSEASFIDNLIFIGITSDSSSVEITCKKRIKAAIYNLFTKKNAEELLEWDDNKSNKNKKKIKKSVKNKNEDKKEKGKEESKAKDYIKEVKIEKETELNMSAIQTSVSKTKNIRSQYNDYKDSFKLMIQENGLADYELEKERYHTLKNQKFKISKLLIIMVR